MSLNARIGILAIGFLSLGGPVSRATPVCAESLNFLKTSCADWQSHILPAALPPSRGNAFADREDAAALGMKIFYDVRFSRQGSGVSCASCHDPEHSFSEAKARSKTINEVTRNAPDLINAAWYSVAHFWDGKTDNLWSAPLFTFEQQDEMGSNRLHVAHALASIYQTRYEKIFGPLPDISDFKRFPETGKPGDPEYDHMSAADKLTVNRIYANVGKALEAYIRKLAAGMSAFEDFMTGSEKSLSPSAQRGMLVFTQHDCNSCHRGPTFSDESFHNISGRKNAGQAQDPGREAAIGFARNWPFSSTGSFADPPLPVVAAPVARKAVATDRGAFRTASLRNVALTGPYGHDGSWDTLEKAIDGHVSLLMLQPAMSVQEKEDLVNFLRALNGRPPLRPWSYWPGG